MVELKEKISYLAQIKALFWLSRFIKIGFVAVASTSFIIVTVLHGISVSFLLLFFVCAYNPHLQIILYLPPAILIFVYTIFIYILGE